MEKEYFMQHLMQYVEFQLENGYELNDIADALLHYGYKKELISKLLNHFKDVEQTRIIKKLPNRDKEIMKEDMAIYIQNMLIDYIKKQQQLGFSLKSIQHALLQVGHRKDVIQKSMAIVKKGDYVDFQQSVQVKKYPLSLLFLLVCIISIAIIFMISVATNENILLVFVTFTPLFIGLILLYALITFIPYRIITILTPPIVLIGVIGLFFYLSSSTTIYKNTDMQILLGLNILIAFFAALIISIFGKMNFTLGAKNKDNFDNVHTANLKLKEHIADEDNTSEHTTVNHHNGIHLSNTAVSHSTHNLINILEDEESVEDKKVEDTLKNKESTKDVKNSKKEKIKIKEFLP